MLSLAALVVVLSEVLLSSTGRLSDPSSPQLTNPEPDRVT
jgi:hypothetical protein